jgi:mannitol/fructose-specific phosphotransferase system IIA component (Ntr-type)
VQIICMVAAGLNQHAEYIRALAAVSGRLKDPAVRGHVLAASEENEVFEIFAG